MGARGIPTKTNISSNYVISNHTEDDVIIRSIMWSSRGKVCACSWLCTNIPLTTPHIHCTWSLDLLNVLLRYFDWNFFTGSTHRRSCLKVLKERYTVDLSILKGKSEKNAGIMRNSIFSKCDVIKRSLKACPINIGLNILRTKLNEGMLFYFT